jgi:hypothetical protein
MMKADLFRERARFPAFHPRSGHSNPVNRAGLDRAVTANFLEAFSAENLTRTGDVTGISELMRIAVLVESVMVFHKRRASDAELGITTESLQQEFEVVRPESNVGIQIGDEGPRRELRVES